MNTKEESFHILLADDDADDREFFSEAIGELKIDNKLSVFNDGKALMDFLEQPDRVAAHILFLDLNMPCKTGIECLREIRENESLKGLSIAIYSTSSSEKDIEESFIGGANVYIKKPNDFSKLKKVIKEVVNNNWQCRTSGPNKESFLFGI